MLDHELLLEIRRENLRAAAAEVGGPVQLAELTDKSESQISHLIGKNPTKPIGEKLAREFEEKLKKPKGWLDKVQGVNDRLLRQVMREIDNEIREQKAKIDDETRGDLISLCYKLIAQYSADKGLVRDVVTIALRSGKRA